MVAKRLSNHGRRELVTPVRKHVLDVCSRQQPGPTMASTKTGQGIGVQEVALDLIARAIVVAAARLTVIGVSESGGRASPSWSSSPGRLILHETQRLEVLTAPECLLLAFPLCPVD